MNRGSGILMPIFSIPNKGKFATFGKEAYDYIDFLARCKQKYWQVLPINDVDIYGSPFSSTCVNSGNPLFIDLKDYISIKDYKTLEENKKISYKEYRKLKLEFLFKISKKHLFDDEVNRFVKENEWIIKYSEFMTIKEEFQSLDKFPKELKNRNSDECRKYLNKHKQILEFYIFSQYLFFKQWKELKRYANELGILIIGDSPCNSSMDSKEAWADSEYYLLDENLTPTFVAGVPPDYFSSEGQVWNTLIYNYQYLKKSNYKYLIDKYKYLLNIYDYLKIDHFRGLEYFYKIPFGESNGKTGQWCEGPGYEFIDLLKNEKIDNLILEDLGIISEGVVRLKEYSGYPGMKVYQFAFDEDNSGFLPRNYIENCVCYTGTHDNDTLYSFLSNDNNREKVCSYLNIDINSDVKRVTIESITNLYNSNANVVIITPQDLLFEGSKYRFNTPGTIKDNWNYTCRDKLYSKNNEKFLLALTKSSKRE